MTKTKEALANASCAVCGAKPKTVDPLPEGWYWDTEEEDCRWAFCPKHNFSPIQEN